MNIEYKGYTFIYSIYKCWLMSIFNMLLFNHTQSEITLRSSEIIFVSATLSLLLLSLFIFCMLQDYICVHQEVFIFLLIQSLVVNPEMK